jgi:hypothetical protein
MTTPTVPVPEPVEVNWKYDARNAEGDIVVYYDTVPPTAPPTTEAEVMLIEPPIPPTTASVGVGEPAPVALPVTGAADGLWLAVGVLLTGTGAACLRWARR